MRNVRRSISTQPDLNEIRRNYEGNRPERYERAVKDFEPLRALGIQRLGLAPGHTVVDVGCGTGLSFSLLREAVGDEGRVIGLDASPDMLDRSRRRIERAGWTNVEVVDAYAHEYQPEAPVDAVAFCFVSQLNCCREVVENVHGWLKPGGRVLAANARGCKGWRGIKQQILFRVILPLIQREDAARWILQQRPWAEIERVFGNVDVELLNHETAFVAVAEKNR